MRNFANETMTTNSIDSDLYNFTIDENQNNLSLSIENQQTKK